MPTPTNPDATTAINRYVESTDARPDIDAFQRLNNSNYEFIDGSLLRAEDSLNLMRRNAINLSRLNSLGLPPGGAVERYFISPATATLKLKQGETETTIPADGTERTVAGIVIKRLADAQGGLSIIEMRAERGQTGARSFLISGGDVAYPAIDFTIRERNESQAESHFETRQQMMTAALERLQLEQGILSATTDRAQRVRSESNLARLRELNLKLTADQAREIDIHQFLGQAREFAREYNEYVRPRPGEMPEAARQRTAFAAENRATIEALNEQLRIMTVAGEVHSWAHARHRNVSRREDAQIVMPDDAMRKKMGEVLSWLDQKNDPAFPPSKQEVEQPWNTLLLKIQQFRTTQNDINRAEVDAAMEGFRSVLLQAVHRITQQRGWLDAGSVGPAFGDIFGIARDPSVRIRTTDVSINAADNVPLLAAIGPTIDLPRAGRQRITVPAGDLHIGGVEDSHKLANGTSRTVGSLTFQRSTDGLTLIVIAAALSADISQDVAIKTSADAAVRTVPVSYRRTGQVQESTMVNALRTGLFIQRHRTVSADIRERVSSPATAVPDAIGLTPGYPRHAITNVPTGPLTVNGTVVAVDARQVVIGGIKVSRNREGGTILWIEPASLDPTGDGLARHRVNITGGGANITTHINFTPGAGDRGANPIRDGIQEARTIRRQYFAYDQEVMTHRLQTNEVLTLQGNLHGLPMPQGWNGAIGVLYESGDAQYRKALDAWIRDASVPNATALRGEMNRLLLASGMPQTVTADNLQSYLEASKAGSIDTLARSRNSAYITAIGNWLRAGDATTVGALVTATNAMLAAQRPPETQVAAAENMERLMRTAGCGHVGLVLRSSIDPQFTIALLNWKNAPTNPAHRAPLVAHANRVLQEIRPPFTPLVLSVTNLDRIMDLAGIKPTPTVPDAETTLIGNLRRKLGETTAETLPLRNAYNRWLIRHTAEAATALVTQANTALSRVGDPYVTAANLTQKLEMAGQETREAVMRGPIGVMMLATYHPDFNAALTAYNENVNHLTTQRMFEKMNLVLTDAGLPVLATTSQVRYLLQISGRLTNRTRAGNTETVGTFQREIELARNQSFNTLSRYYETWNGRLDRGATVQELSEHLLTMGGVMRNDPFAELSQAVDGDRNRNWMRQVWDYSPVGLLHSGVNVASGRPEWSSMTHVRNGSFYGMRESFVPIPRISNGRLRWSGDLTTPTSESAYILQAQGINIDGFEEASLDSRADMLREQLPEEIRKTLIQIREQYRPRLTGDPQGAITLASANHRLLDAYANARPVSRMTGAPMRPPENRPSDYDKVGLLVRLRRTLSTMPAEERIYLEGQANSRIANAADRTLSILPNFDGTPAQPLTGLPAWLTGDTWPTAEGDFEGLEGPQAVYAYVVLMNRFRTAASPATEVQASITALPALSDVRTNDDAAGQSMGMYRYLLDRQSILQDGMRIVSQDYSTACARAVELHIMQAQTNHALQGSNNLDALLLAAGLAQFWVYGAARNIYRNGVLGGLYRSTIGTRGYILQPLTWAPRDIVTGAGRGGAALWRRIFGATETHSATGRALTASEAINLQNNIGRTREIATELARLRGTHADAVSRITKNLQSQIAGLNPVTDAARIQQLEAAAAREIQLAQQANAQVVRQLQAERTLLGRNVATSLDGVSDATRIQWARTLMGGDDAIRALGRSAAEIQALERGILAAHNVGAGQRLTDLAVDASRNPIMHAGRQLNVRDAKWLRLRQAFEEAGIPWNTASRNMARHLMDGACGQGVSGTARTLSTTAEVAQALSGQRALIQAAVRAGRMTSQEAQVLIALMRAGRLSESQAKVLAAAARAGEIDHAAVAALRSASRWSTFGRYVSGAGRVASFAGAAFDSYVLVSETQALIEGRQRIQKAMQVLAKQLTDAHFEPVGAVDPQTGIAMKYRHSSGFEIDINNMESQLQWINNVEHGGRMLGAGIGLGLFVTSFAVGGPVGLAIAIGGAIITIVITTAAEAWSDLQRARFLHDAPPFLFAVWNSTQALGKPTHEMMKSLKEVSWWRHIILGNVESIRDASVQAMYPAIEKKLAFQLFKEELMQYAPEVFAMVMEDAGGPVAFDTFFTSNTGFNRIYDFWGTELGALTGKNMSDRGQRADAVGDSLATRRAMRYAVARHMIARNAEQRPAAVKRAADAEAVARSRDPLTFAQVEPFLSSFPDEKVRAEILRNTGNPVYLRQAMEALVNHLEIQADMLSAHNVDVDAMNGSWRTDSAERMRLYRAAFKDPLICHQLQREYNDVVPDGDPNQAGGGLINAVRTTQLVAAGLPQDNWELARMHLLGIGGRRRDIDALLSPQVTESVARQQLTSHISNYVGTRPNGRYARVDSTAYFPTTTDGRERPAVYLSYPDTFMNGAQAQVTAKCRNMCSIASEFPGLTNSANLKMKAVAFNVVPIRAHRVQRTSRGLLEHPAREEYDETHYLINATYYLENQADDNRQTIIATKGAYLYQNGANTLDVPRNNTTWYTHTGAMQLQSYQAFLGTREQNRSGNRELDTLVNGDLASRLTEDAIQRSEDRYGPREPMESRPERFRREPLVDTVFNNTRNRPVAFVSTTYGTPPHNYTFDPTSPEYALCQALASPTNQMAEDNPQAVLFEFERRGNEITALATYVDGTSRVRRRSARATIRSRLSLRGGERAQTIEGVVHTGSMVHGVDMNRVSAFRHFILNGGDTEGDENQLTPRGNRTVNLWEAQVPQMGVPTLNLIQRSVKRRNRERVEEALKAVGEDSGSLVPGKFVPAGLDDSGRAQYIMHLPRADNGRDAYVLKSVRNPQQAMNAATSVPVRIGDTVRNIQLQQPNPDQFDTYTYHSQGDQWDETVSLSDLSELLRRPNLTFHDRERAMRLITAGHDRTSDAEPVQSELLRFLSNFRTEVLPGGGQPPSQDQASFVLAVRVSAAYEAATDKNAFLWELSDRITQLSGGIVLFEKIPDITRDLGNRPIPRSLSLPTIGDAGLALNSGINEYAVRYYVGENMPIATINESPVTRRYSSGRVDRLNREGVSSKVYVRRYGSDQTVVRSNGFIQQWSTLNYLHDRTGGSVQNAQRREILDNIITAPSTIRNPGTDRTQLYHFMRPVNRILDGWMYEEQCFDVRDQVSNASDGRQRFAGIVGRMYIELPEEQRQNFLRALFTVMETVDGSDGQHDGILSANWHTPTLTDITRELEGSTLCVTFQSVIMELRRRFPVSEERLARESLRSMGTLPSRMDAAMAPTSRQAVLTTPGIQIGDLRYNAFVRGARQPDTTVLRQAVVRVVPQVTDEQGLLALRNWSAESPTLQTGVTATDGVAAGSNPYRARELRYPLNYVRRVAITNATPTIPVNELPVEPLYFNGTLVPTDAADLTIGPVKVTRTNGGRSLSVVRVNTGADLNNFDIRIMAGPASIEPLRYGISDVRLLKPGYVPTGGRALNESSRTYWLDLLAIPVEKRVGKLLNGEPLRQLLDICSREFNREQGVDRKYDLYRGLSDMYWRCNDQERFLQVLIEVLSGQQAIPGASGNITVDGIIREANIPHIVAYMGAAARNAGPRAYRIESVEPAFAEPPETAARGTPEYVNFQMRGLRDRVLATATVTREQLQESINEISQSIGGVEFTPGNTLRNAVGDPIALNDNSAAIMLNDAGRLGICELDALRKSAVAQWQGIINASGAENEASLDRRIERLQYIMQGVHCLGETVPEIETAEPKEWRLSNHLFTLRMNGEDAFALEAVTPPTVDGLFGGVREAAEGGRWQEVDEACTTGAIAQNIRFLTPENRTALLERINKALPLTTTVRFVLGPRSIAVENLSQIEREDRAAPERVTPAARDARRKTLFDSASANSTAPRYAETLIAAITAINADYVRTPLDERAAFVTALNTRFATDGLQVRVRANGEALERAPDVNLVQPVSTRFNALVAAARVGSPSLPATTQTANITAAIALLAPHVVSLESADRPAFVATLNRQLREAGTVVQLRLNGQVLERGPDATGVTVTAPALVLPNVPEASEYRESRVLLRMFIQKRNAENTAWLPGFIRIDNPSGTVAAGNELLASWGIVKEDVDAGLALESYFDGQYTRFRNDTAGRHAYTYRFRFNQSGRFRMTGQLMVNGRAGDAIPETLHNVTADASDVSGVRNILAQAQIASPNRWNEVAGGTAGTRYHYDVANRRLHSFDGTSYRTLNANYTWTAASTTRPSGLPAPG